MKKTITKQKSKRSTKKNCKKKTQNKRDMDGGMGVPARKHTPINPPRELAGAVAR